MEQEATSLLSLKRDALGDIVSQQDPRLPGLYHEHGGLQAALQIHRRQLARLLTEPTFTLPAMTRPSSPSLLAQSLGHLPIPLYRDTTSIRTHMLQEMLLRNEVNRYLEDRLVRAQHLELLKSHSPPTAISFEPVARVMTNGTFDRPGSVPAVSPLAVSPVPMQRNVDVENEASTAKRPMVDRKKKQPPSVAVEASSKQLVNVNCSGHLKKNKDLKWLASLEKLKIYKDQFGDCIVPRGYAQDPQLASWVAEQRKQYKLLQDGKQSSITPERVALLQDLGFSWNAQESAWSRHLEDLKEFRAEHGHCHVPLAHPQYPKLGLWTKEQRRHYTLLKQGKQSHMTLERVRELDKVGFCWDTHEATWLERYRELVSFKETNGHCLVPTNFTQNVKLGTWIHHQRRQYKKHKEGKPCHITDDRIRALDSLGFVWSTRAGKLEASGSICSDTETEHDEELNPTVTLNQRPLKRQRAQCSGA